MNSLKQSPRITVAIRKRPINKKQLQRSETDIIRVQSQGTVILSEFKQKVDLTKYIEETNFNFDYAFDQNSNNEQIYSSCIQPLIDSAFLGAKVSCFAYGQTGSGKTFTMKGDIEKGVPGLYYLGAREIFEYLNHPNFQHLEASVSFFQIYCGKLFDLLNSRNELKIREDKKSNINVIGIQEKPIRSPEQFLELIEYGSNFRVTSQNATNADSSRSHAILQIHLKEGKKTFTKISFIDLAGNERGADHMDQNKQTKIDGAQINKSLLALKQCIRALDQAKGHTPFRGSKLTMVLKDSFVGFCKTVMIGNVSPNVAAADNTMNTLRYADRVKELKGQSDNTPMTKQEQLAKQMMLPRANKNSFKVNIQDTDDQEDIQMKREAARKGQKKGPRKQQWNNNQMDIEQQQQPQPLQRRRTDMYQADNLMKQQGQRKSMVPKMNQQSLQDENNPRRHENFAIKSTKQIKGCPQPKPRNLHVQMVDNCLGMNNKNRNHFPKIQLNNFNQNQGGNNQQKMHFEHQQMSQQIQQMKSQFLNDHFNLIKEEGSLLRQEGMFFQKISRNPQFDLPNYMNSVQSTISRKIETLMALQNKAKYLTGKIQDCDNLGNMIKAENNIYDEQLLQGLPCDDFGGRLF